MKNKKKIIAISIIVLSVLSIIGLLILFINASTKKSQSEPKEVTHLNSLNYSVSYNTPENIQITDASMSGYRVADVCYATMNIDKTKAFEKLKDYIVFYNGEPVHVDLNITPDFSDGRLSITYTLPSGIQKSYKSSITWIPAYEGVEFMTLGTVSGYRFATVIEKRSITTDYDVNKIAKEAFTRMYSRNNGVTLPKFDLTYNDCLQEECETWSRSYYEPEDGVYKFTMTNIRILNDITISAFEGHENNDEYDASKSTSNPLNQHLSPENAPDTNNPDNPNSGIKQDLEAFGNSIKEGFKNFKTNMENNQTFRIATIAISSVIGIGLLYVIFLIIRKVWRVIKN